MKTKELRQKSKSELQEFLQEKQARVEELRWLLRQKKAKNVGELREARKDIARIKTLFS